MKPRRQKNPARDAALTESLHALLSRLKEPARPPDGVRGPLGIIGWVQVDVRFLEGAVSNRKRRDIVRRNRRKAKQSKWRRRPHSKKVGHQ